MQEEWTTRMCLRNRTWPLRTRFSRLMRQQLSGGDSHRTRVPASRTSGSTRSYLFTRDQADCYHRQFRSRLGSEIHERNTYFQASLASLHNFDINFALALQFRTIRTCTSSIFYAQYRKPFGSLHFITALKKNHNSRIHRLAVGFHHLMFYTVVPSDVSTVMS